MKGALGAVAHDSPELPVRRRLNGRAALTALEAFSRSGRLIAILILLGVALRSAQFLSNRSLAIDEAFLALNLFHKSAGDLLGSLDFNQAAPVGFLEAEKLIVEIFGRGEFALRIFPFLSSILALLLFPRAARALVGPRAVPLALALFAIFDPLIYYASFAKPYSADVAIALLLYAALVPIPLDRAQLRGFVAYAALGAGVVWLSHPSVFVLTGIGIVATVSLAHRARWRRLGLATVTHAVWLASFGLHYVLTRASLEHVRGTLAYGSESTTFLYAPDSSPGEGAIREIADSLRYLVGVEDTATGRPVLDAEWLAGVSLNHLVPVVAFVAAGVGFASLLSRRRAGAALLGIPALATGAAAALGEYPLSGRTVLFLVPAFLLCVAQGIVYVAVRARGAGARAAALAAVTTLVAAVAVLPARFLVEPRVYHGMKAAVEYLGNHARPGDTLYVTYAAQYALRYYVECSCAPGRVAEIWQMRPAAGGTFQLAPVLLSDPPRFVVGEPRDLGIKTYRTDLETLLRRKRV